MTPPNDANSRRSSEGSPAPQGSAAPRLRRTAWLGLRSAEWALVAAIVVAVLLTGVVDSNHSYFRLPWQSLTDILRNTALLGIFALGATVVIIAGGIDLSSGSMIALSGTIAATAMLALAPKEIMAFKPVGPAVVGVGVLAALLTGFLVGTPG
jgi:ribose/xylose/arabinose/galactoside ABC-type transport system permease subunit